MFSILENKMGCLVLLEPTHELDDMGIVSLSFVNIIESFEFFFIYARVPFPIGLQSVAV